MRAATVEDAIDIINASPYGNMACLFTASGAAARRFRYEARTGNIGINVVSPRRWPTSRFRDGRTASSATSALWPPQAGGVSDNGCYCVNPDSCETAFIVPIVPARPSVHGEVFHSRTVAAT